MTRMKRWQVWTASAVATVGLAAVSQLYTQPDFLVQLANQMWTCF